MDGLHPLVVLLLALAAGCAPRLGTVGVDADLPTGIGGRIWTDSGQPEERAAEAWSRFHATDAAFGELLAWPPYRYGHETEDLRVRVEAVDTVERGLRKVLDLGVSEPAVAALVRLGRVYEGTQAWLQGAPDVPPRYRTPGYRRVYPVIRMFDRDAPPPWPPEPVPGIGCPAFPSHDQAVAAYERAVEESRGAGLLGNGDARYALARLSVLAPDRWEPRFERLPQDPFGFEE